MKFARFVGYRCGCIIEMSVVVYGKIAGSVGIFNTPSSGIAVLKGKNSWDNEESPEGVKIELGYEDSGREVLITRTVWIPAKAGRLSAEEEDEDEDDD